MEYVEKQKSPTRRSAAKSTARTARSAPVDPVEDDEPIEFEELVDDVSDEEEPAPPVSAGSSRRRPDLLAMIGAALAVLVLAALAFFVFEWTSASNKYDSSNSLRNSALKAATTYGGYLSSYNYQNLNGPTTPWGEVDSHSTASFRKDFDATKSNLSSLVNDYKATATGKVIAAGVNSVSSRRAVVLLFIDQTVTNTAQKPGTTTQPLRVELVMARQQGHWLIDQLQVPS